MLIERWFWCDWTLVQSSVSSFDQGEIIWCDWTLRGERPDAGCQHSIDSSKVPEREIVTGRVRSVLTERCPASDHNLKTGFRGELTGRPVNLTKESGHPAEAHNGSF